MEAEPWTTDNAHSILARWTQRLIVDLILAAQRSMLQHPHHVLEIPGQFNHSAHYCG